MLEKESGALKHPIVLAATTATNVQAANFL